MASWDTVRILVLCAGPSSRRVSAFYFLTSSASLTERRGGPTLGSVSILFAGTASAVNFRFGFILGGRERFSVVLGTLGGVKEGTGGLEKNDGVGKRCGAGSPHSFLHALFCFRMFPIVISSSSVVLMRCSRGFFFSSWYILSIAAIIWSSGFT